MSDLACQVCVAGGGPAGATLARRLALLGHDVCLVERAPSAARRPGESLAPGILPILEALGVREAVERAGFFRPDHARVRWSDEDAAPRDRGAAPGFQIDRARFDALLLDAAARAGVRVLRPARAGAPAPPDASGWSVPVHHEGRWRRVRAAFLCDATGRRGLLRGPRLRSSVPTVVLSGYLRGVAVAGTESLVDACDDAWLWGAPLPDGTFSAMAFVDPQRVRGQSSRGAREALYRELLARSPLLRRCLDGVLDGPVVARDASAYQREDPVGAAWIRVGEASFGIDPLASQGVQAAMSSALQAAVVVHTLLDAPPHAGAAERFYRERQAEAVARHRGWAARLYAERRASLQGPFWRRRAALAEGLGAPALVARAPVGDTILAAGARLALAAEASIEAVPCIHGDLVMLRRALAHPRLDRPVAYLGDTELAPLLDLLAEAGTVRAALACWSRCVPPDRARAILGWLVGHGVLVAPKPP